MLLISGLLWTFYHLSNHSEVEKRVVEEIKSVVGDEELTNANTAKLK